MEGEITCKLNAAAASVLQELINIDSSPDKFNSIVEKCKLCNNQISLSDFILISKWIMKNKNIEINGEPLHVHSLIKSIQLETPIIIKRPVNTELKERLKRLEAQQKHREYNKMVYNITTKTPQNFNYKTAKRSTAVSGLNFAISVVAAFGLTMYVLQYAVPDVFIRTGIAIAVAMSLLFIEMFLAVRHIEKQS